VHKGEPPVQRRRTEGTAATRARKRGRTGARSRVHTSDVTISLQGVAHVRLTVTDIDRSRAFYDRVFGLPVAFEIASDADEQTRQQLAFLYGGVIYRLGTGLLGLRPVAAAQDRFDEDRVGLDHLSLAVADRHALQAAADHLDSLGVPHGGIKDLGGSAILEFRDPDNIALELFAVEAG
jgi:glyoxylase I family protein